MPTTVLGLLGVLLCALAVTSQVTPQKDLKRVRLQAGRVFVLHCGDQMSPKDQPAVPMGTKVYKSYGMSYFFLKM